MLPTAPTPSDPTLTFLPKYWHKLIMPCLSLLADECQLSIIAIEQATPLLLNGIYYQFVHVTQSPQAKQTLINNYLSDSFHTVQGINFQQIARLRPHIASFHQAFFSNEKTFWLLVGVVSARTGISPSRLQPLTDWLAFLALQSTAQCLKLTHTSLMTFTQWLPHSLLDPKLVDITMLESILIDSDTRPSQFFNTSQCLSNTKIENRIETDFFAEHKTILQSYQQRQPFGIVPLSITENQQNATTTLPQPSKPALIKNSASPAPDIFTTKPPANTPWHSVLQKHWMAFAAGLTALVIGGIGAVATINKTPPTAPTIDNKTLADIPHDVAIVRTDTTTKTSAISDSKTKSPKPSAHENHSSDKGTDKNTKKTKSTKSEKVKGNKSPNSHEKVLTNQTEKASTNKNPKSTAKKSIKKPSKPHDDED